jgi:hypothetical protein
MPRLLCVLAILMPAVCSAQVAHRSGSAHTPEVDLGYATFGEPGAEIPIFAVNGGPGLSHADMMQNDLWQRVAAHRLVILYDQRGTGASKQVQPNAPQSMDAQVADLDAIREALKLDHVAVLCRRSHETRRPVDPFGFCCALVDRLGSSRSTFSRDENEPAGLSHCAQLNMRRYALRRPAACLDYCAADRGGLK